MARINYDPRRVSIIVNGSFVTGYADGTFFMYEKTTDDATPHEGADGEVDYSENASNSCMVTVTVKHTSPTNQYLTQLANSRASIDMTMKDANANGETFSGESGRIVRIPNNERGKEITNREWQFYFPNFKIS